MYITEAEYENLFAYAKRLVYNTGLDARDVLHDTLLEVEVPTKKDVKYAMYRQREANRRFLLVADVEVHLATVLKERNGKAIRVPTFPCAHCKTPYPITMYREISPGHFFLYCKTCKLEMERVAHRRRMKDPAYRRRRREIATNFRNAHPGYAKQFYSLQDQRRRSKKWQEAHPLNYRVIVATDNRKQLGLPFSMKAFKGVPKYATVDGRKVRKEKYNKALTDKAQGYCD